MASLEQVVDYYLRSYYRADLKLFETPKVLGKVVLSNNCKDVKAGDIEKVFKERIDPMKNKIECEQSTNKQQD